MPITHLFLAISFNLSCYSLLPLPKRTERTVFAMRKVLALFMRAAHVSVAHRHGFDTVLEEETFISCWTLGLVVTSVATQR